MEAQTLGYLIEQAVSWEVAARGLYESLARRFGSRSEIARFWLTMAADECTHADELRRLRDALTPGELARQLAPEDSRRILAVEETLAQAAAMPLDTLDDAYEIAHALEGSEVNSVFEIVMTDGLESEAHRAPILAQLSDHLRRLDAFSDAYPRSVRRTILVPVGTGAD